jgi:hypothetical protein
MIWVADSLPDRHLFQQQVWQWQAALATKQIFDFLGVFLQRNEVQVAGGQELLHLTRERSSQTLRFVACGEHFADAKHCLVALLVLFTGKIAPVLISPSDPTISIDC